MNIKTIKTGSVLVSPAIPNGSAHWFKYAYTGLFQLRSNRITVPVKCFYITIGSHHILIDTGWSKEVIEHPIKHLGFGIWFSSEPVMKLEEAAINQLKDQPIDGIYMTHLDCDHASGLKIFLFMYQRKNMIIHNLIDFVMVLLLMDIIIPFLNLKMIL